MTTSPVDVAIVFAMMQLSAAWMWSKGLFCIGFRPSRQTATATLVKASLVFLCGDVLELSNMVGLQS